MDSFRRESRFSTWLYRIAYNCFLQDRRKNRSYKNRKNSYKQTLDNPADTQSNLMSLELERAMAFLSDPERTAITFCYFLGLTHQEASGILDCPIGTVKTNILRGKEKLRQRLSSRGGRNRNEKITRA